jgi:O-antigen/teichoic acid export membrane protein
MTTELQPEAGALPPLRLERPQHSAEDAAPFRMGRVGRQTAIYGVGIVATKMLSFLLLPLYTHFLSPADYGVIQLVQMTFEVISIVAGARMAGGMFRFHQKAATDQERRAVFSTALVLLTTSFLLVAAGVFAGATTVSRMVFETPEYGGVIRIAAVSFVFQGLMIAPLAWFRVREQSHRFVAASVGMVALQAALNVFFLVVLRAGVVGMFVSALLTNVIVGVIVATMQIRVTGARVSREPLRGLLRFGWPLVVTQVATFFLTFGDRYFLERVGGPAAVGLYALAYSFGFLLAGVAFQPFLSVWDPIRYEVAARTDRDAIFARAFVYVNVILVSFAVAISLFVHEFLDIMTTPAFAGAASVVPVILVAYVLQCWSAIHDMGIMLSERTGLSTLANWAAAAVALAGYLLLIPRYLAWGAALSTLAAFAVRQAVIYVASQRLLPIRYHWAPVLRLTLLAVAVVAADLLVPPRSLPASLAVSSALFALYLCAIWFAGVLPPADRAYLRRLAATRSLERSALATLVTGRAGAR